MTDLVTRRALPLWVVCLLAPAAGAQPTLWGTASANTSFPNGRLLKIDYASGVVLATYNGPSGVTIGDGYTGVAVRPSNGQVFVTDGLGTNRVYRFDPNTGAVLGFFPSPTGSDTIDGLEFLGDELYASKFGNTTIVRINPDTGALIGTLPQSIPSSVAGGLTIAGGALYTHGSTSNVSIARRDLTTGAVLSEFPTPNGQAVKALATDGVSLYAAEDNGVIYRCALDTGAVLDSRTIGIAFDGLGGPAPVPEPSAGLLSLAVVFAVSVWRRSRRAARTGESVLQA